MPQWDTSPTFLSLAGSLAGCSCSPEKLLLSVWEEGADGQGWDLGIQISSLHYSRILKGLLSHTWPHPNGVTSGGWWGHCCSVQCCRLQHRILSKAGIYLEALLYRHCQGADTVPGLRAALPLITILAVSRMVKISCPGQSCALSFIRSSVLSFPSAI